MLEPQIDRDLYPFTSQWFSSSAGRVHYVDEGQGRPILFCHGSPTWSFLFRTVIVTLRDRYRCIAVDHLGFGLSERPDGFEFTVAEHTDVLDEFIEHLELDDLIVVAHDWGGPIGVGAATRHPDRIGGVALTNTALWPIDRWPNRAFSAVMSTAPLQRRILDDNLLVEKVLLGRAGPTLTAAEADQYRLVQPTGARQALAVAPREIRAARPLLGELEHVIADHLAGVPALAVWGMRDRVFPARSALPRLRRMFDDLTVVELDDAEHFTAEDAPAAVAAAIAERFGA